VVQELPLAGGAGAGGAPAAGQTAPAINPLPGFPIPAPGAGASHSFGSSTASSDSGGVNISGHAFSGGSADTASSAGTSGGVNLNFGAATTHTTSTAQTQPALDPDVQKILIVANHLKAIQDNAEEAIIYPPTGLEDQAGIPSNQAPDTNAAAQ